MLVSDFFTTVSGAIRRGTALDAEIPGAFRQALQFIEQNYALPYMWKKSTLSVAAATREFVWSGTDANSLRNIRNIRWLNTIGEWNHLKQVDELDFRSTEGTPEGYIMMTEMDTGGVQSRRFEMDAAFDEATSLTISAYHFTRWNGDQAVGNIWLINNAESAIMARTMINLSPHLRDPQVMQMYQALWAESLIVLRAAAAAEEEANRV